MPGGKCCVYGCQNSSSMKNITLHRFPRDVKLRKIWLANCHSEKAKAKPNMSYVCSAHFRPDDYELNFREQLLGKKLVRLVEGAVPSQNLWSSFRRKESESAKKRRLRNEARAHEQERKAIVDDLLKQSEIESDRSKMESTVVNEVSPAGNILLVCSPAGSVCKQEAAKEVSLPDLPHVAKSTTSQRFSTIKEVDYKTLYFEVVDQLNLAKKEIAALKVDNERLTNSIEKLKKDYVSEKIEFHSKLVSTIASVKKSMEMKRKNTVDSEGKSVCTVPICLNHETDKHGDSEKTVESSCS